MKIILSTKMGSTNKVVWLGGNTNLPPFEIRKSTNLTAIGNGWISFTNITRSADGTNYLYDTSVMPTNVPTFYKIVATNGP